MSLFANLKLLSEGAGHASEGDLVNSTALPERVFEDDLVKSIVSPEAWCFQKQVGPPRNADQASKVTLPIAELRWGARFFFRTHRWEFQGFAVESQARENVTL